MQINPKAVCLIGGIGMIVGAIFGLQPALITCGILIVIGALA